MKFSTFIIFLATAFACSSPGKEKSETTTENTAPVLVKLCVENDRITQDWRNALTRRESKQYLDSLENVTLKMTAEELGWYELMKSRSEVWSSIKDSIRIPFADTEISDTTYVFLGYQGKDDGFSYQYNTVCFDLTAMYNTYGAAGKPENTNRADRFFAHEYTHLLSKEWARQNDLVLTNFRDSILWECIYEGLGMYRSMSPKWFPIADSLSVISAKTFETLYPTFSEKMIAICEKDSWTNEEKKNIHKYLSYGPMRKKWGALPVGVWLALEAKGGAGNLIKWVNQGHEAVIPLAKKYLKQDLADQLTICD